MDQGRSIERFHFDQGSHLICEACDVTPFLLETFAGDTTSAGQTVQALNSQITSNTNKTMFNTLLNVRLRHDLVAAS